jgi:hypothetical protein
MKNNAGNPINEVNISSSLSSEDQEGTLPSLPLSVSSCQLHPMHPSRTVSPVLTSVFLELNTNHFYQLCYLTYCNIVIVNIQIFADPTKREIIHHLQYKTSFTLKHVCMTFYSLHLSNFMYFNSVYLHTIVF